MIATHRTKLPVPPAVTDLLREVDRTTDPWSGIAPFPASARFWPGLAVYRHAIWRGFLGEVEILGDAEPSVRLTGHGMKVLDEANHAALAEIDWTPNPHRPAPLAVEPEADEIPF